MSKQYPLIVQSTETSTGPSTAVSLISQTKWSSKNHSWSSLTLRTQFSSPPVNKIPPWKEARIFLGSLDFLK